MNAKTVYIDLQDDKPTLWDNPGPGRTEMIAIIRGNRPVGILPASAISAVANIVDYMHDDEERHWQENPDQPGHIFHDVSRLAELCA